MADLVLGLAKTVVNGTVIMAKSAIEEEEKLKKSVQRDLMLISDEFEMMHSFLSVANDNVPDDMATTSVRQVREMALDVEDCIESIIHLEDKSTWWRSMLPSCIPAHMPAAALHSAIADIELLKTRLEAMVQRNARYRHIGDSTTKPVEKMPQQAMSNSASASTIDDEARDLIELINNEDDKLQVISVFGNVGTMSVIKEAYTNQEICQKFRCRAWVRFMHPFNPQEFMRSLVAQFCGHESTVNPSEEMMAAAEGVHVRDFMKLMSHRNYLVILEDVSTMDDWEAARVYLPDKKNGSCIIVNTQQMEMATLCVGHPYQVAELEKYSADHSVFAFYKEDEEISDKTKIARDWLENFHCVGRKGIVPILDFFMSPHSEGSVVSICGIPGVGKSSLIKQAYYRQFQNISARKFGWVTVSQPFNLREMSRSLLLDLQSKSLRQSSILRIKDPIQECREFLQEYCCLVVIDGVLSKYEWDLINDAFSLAKARTVTFVITNEDHVATYCASKSQVLVLGGLEQHHAFDLFKKEICWSEFSPEETYEIEHILHKCGGLPKVIVAVARQLRNKERSRLKFSLMTLSDSFMPKIETNEEYGCLQGLFSWVHSYFRTCEDFLKPCIFYLSIFPVNSVIRRRRLVRRWIAEGYCRSTKEGTSEDTAEEFLVRLLKLSMIGHQHLWLFGTKRLRFPSCKVNGFFREYIMSRSMEENLVFALEGRRGSLNLNRTGRHLTIASSWNRNKDVFERIDFVRLRSLTVFGEWKSFFICEKMRVLRVLDLEDVYGVEDGDVEVMVKWLPRLKFFSLRGCKGVKRLPDSMGGLKQLQTLDIRNTFITALPKSIINLEKLQYLRAGTPPQSEDDPGMVIEAPSARVGEPVTAGEENPSLPDDRTSTIGSPLLLQQRPVVTDSLPLSRPSISSRRLITLVSTWLPKLGIGNRQLNNGIKIPRGIIGNLRALHTLGVVNIGSIDKKTILKELMSLGQLRKLGVSGISRYNCKDFFSAISELHLLESLSVYLDNDNQTDYLNNSSSPPRSLQSLKIFRLASKLPAWIGQLPNLQKVSLKMSVLQKGEIARLGQPPFRKVLRLCLTELQDEELDFSEDGIIVFFSLVNIACNSRLKAVRFHGSCYITVLKISCCPGLSSIKFFGLENLTDLKEVWLKGTYDATVKQDIEIQLASFPMNSRPVLRFEEPQDGIFVTLDQSETDKDSRLEEDSIIMTQAMDQMEPRVLATQTCGTSVEITTSQTMEFSSCSDPGHVLCRRCASGGKANVDFSEDKAIKLMPETSMETSTTLESSANWVFSSSKTNRIVESSANWVFTDAGLHSEDITAETSGIVESSANWVFEDADSYSEDIIAETSIIAESSANWVFKEADPHSEDIIAETIMETSKRSIEDSVFMHEEGYVEDRIAETIMETDEIRSPENWVFTAEKLPRHSQDVTVQRCVETSAIIQSSQNWVSRSEPGEDLMSGSSNDES